MAGIMGGEESGITLEPSDNSKAARGYALFNYLAI